MFLFCAVICHLLSVSFGSHCVRLKGGRGERGGVKEEGSSEHAQSTSRALQKTPNHKPTSTSIRLNHFDNCSATQNGINGKSEYVTREMCKLQMEKFIAFYANAPFMTNKGPVQKKDSNPLAMNEKAGTQLPSLTKQDKLNVPVSKLRISGPSSNDLPHQPQHQQPKETKQSCAKDNRKGLEAWSKRLILDREYFESYRSRVDLSTIPRDCIVEYLCVENSYKILLISQIAGCKMSYILKILTPYEYHNESIVQPLIGTINSRYFPKTFHISPVESISNGEYHSMLMEYVDALDLFAFLKIQVIVPVLNLSLF